MDGTGGRGRGEGTLFRNKYMNTDLKLFLIAYETKENTGICR